MLHTPFTAMFEIEVPVLQAAIWPATSPKLVAAVSNAGAIGTVAAIFASADHVREQIGRVRALTDRPFVVNHVVPALDAEAFDVTLEARPAAVSLALGDPGELVARAHDAGVRVIHQVHTTAQAREAAQRGVDVIIAQGSEAGGQGMVGGVGALALATQVVDAVAPIPVLVAGGVADGRGLAAALVLGAAGANVGTRFLASDEAAASDEWKQAIIAAQSEDTVRFATWASIMPPGPGAYEVVPRVIRTDFVSEWQARPDDARDQAEELRGRIMGSVKRGRPDELTPFTGQTAGLVGDVRPAAEIVHAMAREARAALSR